MQTQPRRDLESTFPLTSGIFLVAVAVWVVASMILAIPHGYGHPIESMRPIVVLRDAALPVWIGSFAALLAALALRAWRSLGPR
jgi:hypothetical protein